MHKISPGRLSKDGPFSIRIKNIAVNTTITKPKSDRTHQRQIWAHELLTLAKPTERPADKRPANSTKFSGREGIIYTVQGKGGLKREVLLPVSLSRELERCRRPAPVTVQDREINYLSRYLLAGGQPWSNSFSAASNRALNWSRGAHGLRHSYAQERMHELQSLGLTRLLALETVSQEMGHFRPEITETYLR